MARWIRDCFQLSIRRACALSCLRNATWYYRSQARDSSALRKRLRELATTRPRFGYERLHILLVREGWRVGRKRVHRLYKPRGAPGSYESPAQEAHQPASGAGADCDRKWSMLGNGFRS
jgi:transposase InsO family protein